MIKERFFIWNLFLLVDKYVEYYKLIENYKRLIYIFITEEISSLVFSKDNKEVLSFRVRVL